MTATPALKTPRVLTEKRKADRVYMSNEVAKLAKDLGCKVEQVTGDENTFPGPHTQMVKIVAPGGLRLNVDFDGHSCQMDVHVLSWHMSYEVPAKLNPAAFAYNSVNTVHYHKATDVAQGFEDLMRCLALRLKACADGSAYQATAASGERVDRIDGRMVSARPNLQQIAKVQSQPKLTPLRRASFALRDGVSGVL